MLRLGFEPTTPVFERANAVHASDRATTVIGGVRNGSAKCVIGPFLVHLTMFSVTADRLCGLVVRVPGYRS
jgi:hypothetical protein